MTDNMSLGLTFVLTLFGIAASWAAVRNILDEEDFRKKSSQSRNQRSVDETWLLREIYQDQLNQQRKIYWSTRFRYKEDT